jgi:hypothetical protein
VAPQLLCRRAEQHSVPVTFECPLTPSLDVWLALAANVGSPPILWKNNVLQAQKVTFQKKRKRLSY